MAIISERLEKLNASSSASVNPRVSMALHPDMISDHGPVLVDCENAGPTINAYDAARQALRVMHESATQIDKAHQSMLVSVPKVGVVYAKGSAPIFEKVIPPERRAELSSAMASSMKRTAAAVQRNVDAVDACLAKLNGFIEAKTRVARPNEAAVVAECVDIRAYLKGMKPESRMSFLQGACESKDISVVHAVLNASCFTSGLDRQQHAILRQFANECFAGVETKQRAALLDVKAKIEQATRSYASEYQRRLPEVGVDASDAPLAALRAA